MTEAGSQVTLPPGVHLSTELWIRLDTETRRLQELEIRLTAENDSLRADLSTQNSSVGVIGGVIAGILFGSLVF